MQDHADSAAYREQTVEVALGPEGAFENGNIGTPTRRVPASQVVSAVPKRTRRALRSKARKEPKTPPVVEVLRKAIEWRRQLDAGEVRNQADIARREDISRARVTQILTLLRLAPEIQKHILALPQNTDKPTITERALRPIAQIENPEEQWACFRAILR